MQKFEIMFGTTSTFNYENSFSQKEMIEPSESFVCNRPTIENTDINSKKPNDQFPNTSHNGIKALDPLDFFNSKRSFYEDKIDDNYLKYRKFNDSYSTHQSCLNKSNVNENGVGKVNNKQIKFPWMKTTKSHAKQWKSSWIGWFSSIYFFVYIGLQKSGVFSFARDFYGTFPISFVLYDIEKSFVFLNVLYDIGYIPFDTFIRLRLNRLFKQLLIANFKNSFE